jgi:hypothetical protein
MTIDAKYPGRCSECGGRIRVGERIEWAKGAGARHTRCSQEATAAQSDTSPAPIHLSGGSGYGCEGWTVGQVILSSEKRRRAGGPDALVVVRASKQRIREDGMSFGVGEDDGYAYSADCRAATAEELRAVIDTRTHGQALEANREIDRKRLFADFEAAGYLPEAEADQLAAAHGAESILLVVGTNGGRRWVLVEAETLTLIDGGYYDDYRRSAQRLPRTAELERRVRALAVETK